MFIDNNIFKKIQECNSIDELIKFITDNKNMLLAFKSDIITAIDRINKNNEVVKINLSIFDCLFYTKNTVSDNEFEFLNFYCNNTFSLSSYIIDGSIDQSVGALILLLLDKEVIYQFEKENKDNIIYHEMERSLYSKLLDLYVPCEDPKSVVDELMSTKLMLGDYLAMSYDKNKFEKSIAVYAQDPNIKQISTEAILLFKYISDIYSNIGTKIETFKKYHYMETKSLPLKDKTDAIEQRYSKYFNDKTVEMIYSVLMIFKQDRIDISLTSFIVNTIEEFSVNDKILIAFLKDVLEISYNYTDAYHYDRSVEILDTVTKIKFEDLVTIANSNVVTNESFVYTPEDGILYAAEAYKKDSVNMHNAQNKIYKAYRNYQDAEDKIDSQVSKAVKGMKNVLIGDVKAEIIEGKKFTAIGLLKQLLATAAIFSFGPIQGAVALVIRYALKKNTTLSERRKIILELEEELEMVNEKIEDARGDNNKKAKYSLMRTRNELNNALKRIKYGLAADERSTNTAKATINSIRSKL